jgi:DoxX-like family
MKLMRPEIVVKTIVQIGYSEEIIVPLGTVLLVCTILYLIPQTSVLGAILLTGYLGGAVATNARIGSPLFSHILFPVYIGVLIWGGLFLHDPRVSALIPLRR